jgi:RHS repeat-associated protein
MEVLFSGYFFEHITGLSIVRRRFLHTALGVWISRDAKQDRSGYVGTYRYCSNSPVGSVDPYGMFTVNDAAISHCKEKVPFGSLQEVIACANALPAQQRFDLWYSLELSDLSWLIGLPDCPCYLWPMASPPTPQELNKAKQCAVITAEYQFASELYQGADPTVWSKPATIKFSVFHPNAKWEIRSIKPNASGASQQCTYDGKGRLITGGVSAGTPDRYQSYSATWGGWFAAGGGYVSNSGHYGHDVDPFNLARELDGGKPGENVDRYLEVRPPNAGKKSDGQPCDKNIVD